MLLSRSIRVWALVRRRRASGARLESRLARGLCGRTGFMIGPVTTGRGGRGDGSGLLVRGRGGRCPVTSATTAATVCIQDIGADEVEGLSSVM